MSKPLIFWDLGCFIMISWFTFLFFQIISVKACTGRRPPKNILHFEAYFLSYFRINIFSLNFITSLHTQLGYLNFRNPYSPHLPVTLFLWQLYLLLEQCNLNSHINTFTERKIKPPIKIPQSHLSDTYTSLLGNVYVSVIVVSFYFW